MTTINSVRSPLEALPAIDEMAPTEVPLVAPVPMPPPAHINRTPLEANEGSSWRPMCSCGWEGGVWQTHHDAMFQIDDHVRHPDGVVPDVLPAEILSTN